MTKAVSINLNHKYDTEIMTGFVSIIIPNRNGEATIDKCLEAAFSSRYENFEVIVVDDASVDRSAEVIKRFPCRFVQLHKHSGAARARNIGADISKGDMLFFTDADCLLKEDTLAIAVETLLSAGPDVVVGGTYTPWPAVDRFFSRFQSVFINYYETRYPNKPDYVATHAMIINAWDFRKSGGFAVGFLPILEDVEFSHRIRQKGYRLLLNPQIQVDHIFGYSLSGSMLNAFKKSLYWSAYSISNRDLFKSSGTASIGLKLNTITWLVDVVMLVLYVLFGEAQFVFAALTMFSINIAWNSGLLAAFNHAGGAGFLAKAAVYYLFLYPVAVGTGGLTGLLRYRQLAETMREAH